MSIRIFPTLFFCLLHCTRKTDKQRHGHYRNEADYCDRLGRKSCVFVVLRRKYDRYICGRCARRDYHCGQQRSRDAAESENAEAYERYHRELYQRDAEYPPFFERGFYLRVREICAENQHRHGRIERGEIIYRRFYDIGQSSLPQIQRPADYERYRARISQDVLEAELRLCEDLIAQGCEAIILNPCGDEAVPAVLAKCQAAGIPLVCVDNTAPGAGYVYCGIDNYAIARGIGQYVGEKYGAGNIVYARSTAIDTGCPAQRFGGIMGGLSDEGEVKGYNIIDERYVEDVSYDEGMRVMEDMIAANDESIDIVICHRDGEALGAITAIENAGLDVKVVTGFDGELGLLEKIKANQGGANGCDIVTGLNSPTMVADMAFQALETHFAGGTMESSYYTPVVVVSYDNIDEYISYGF